MAGRWLPDGPAASPARLCPGVGRVLRPTESGQAAKVAQGRAGRGVPDRGAPRAAVGRASPDAQCRRGPGAEGWMGAVPLVSAGANGREVLPGNHGPGWTMAP